MKKCVVYLGSIIYFLLFSFCTYAGNPAEKIHELYPWVGTDEFIATQKIIGMEFSKNANISLDKIGYIKGYFYDSFVNYTPKDLQDNITSPTSRVFMDLDNDGLFEIYSGCVLLSDFKYEDGTGYDNEGRYYDKNKTTYKFDINGNLVQGVLDNIVDSKGNNSSQNSYNNSGNNYGNNNEYSTKMKELQDLKNQMNNLKNQMQDLNESVKRDTDDAWLKNMKWKIDNIGKY